jgi:hypothetical protein
MNNIASNPCPRCGKARIVVKTWIEEIVTNWGKSKVTHSSTACPDPACQKIVAADLDKQKSKFIALKVEKERREKQALINRKHR